MPAPLKTLNQVTRSEPARPPNPVTELQDRLNDLQSQSVDILEKLNNHLDWEVKPTPTCHEKIQTCILDIWKVSNDAINLSYEYQLNGPVPCAFVLGYNSEQIVVSCPLCDAPHTHKKVNPTFGSPLVYFAPCSSSSDKRQYIVAFPGDINFLIGKDHSDVGIRVHKSGAYWETVGGDMYDGRVQELFLGGTTQARSTNTSSSHTRPDDKHATEVDGLEGRLGRMNLQDDYYYSPIKKPECSPELNELILKLNRIAKTSMLLYKKLELLFAQLNETIDAEYTMRFERGTRYGVTTRSGRKGETFDLYCGWFDESGNEIEALADLNTEEVRTVGCCINGSGHDDYVMISGTDQKERQGSEKNSPFTQKQLQCLVIRLANQIGYKFNLVKGKTQTQSDWWNAAHCEKKLLVKYLINHTDWMPIAFDYKVFTTRSKLLGKEAGHLDAGFMMRKMRCFISNETCADCSDFLDRAREYFSFSLGDRFMNFQVMEQMQSR